MKLLSLLALLVLAMSVAACGTAASTSPPGTSPSVSASPSQKPPTEAENATAYLLAVKPIRAKMNALGDDVGDLVTVREVNKSQSVRDSHADTIKKLAKKLAGLQVDFNLVDVPPSMRTAQRLYAALLASAHLAFSAFIDSLSEHPYEEGWQMANSYMATANRAADKSHAQSEAWVIEVKTQAKKLGIKVPWKWRD